MMCTGHAQQVGEGLVGGRGGGGGGDEGMRCKFGQTWSGQAQGWARSALLAKNYIIIAQY